MPDNFRFFDGGIFVSNNISIVSIHRAYNFSLFIHSRSSRENCVTYRNTVNVKRRYNFSPTFFFFFSFFYVSAQHNFFRKSWPLIVSYSFTISLERISIERAQYKRGNSYISLGICIFKTFAEITGL